MPYTPDTWANNDPTKPLNAARLTKLAGQYPQVMEDLPAKIADSGDPIGAALNGTIGSVAGGFRRSWDDIFAAPAAGDTPTVTVGTVAPSGVTLIAPTRVSDVPQFAFDPAFRYNGCVGVQAADATFINATTDDAGTPYLLHPEFVTDRTNDRFIIYGRSALTGSTINVRVVIDGRWHSIPAQSFATTGANVVTYITVTFPTARSRVIRLENSGMWRFGGVYVPTGETLTRPSSTITRRMAFIGDSFIGGSGAPSTGASRIDTWAHQLAFALGSDHFLNMGIGGSRWNPAHADYFAERFPPAVAAHPHIIAVGATGNDGTGDGAMIYTQALAALRLAEDVPAVLAFSTSDNRDPVNSAAQSAAVRDAAAVTDRTWVDINGSANAYIGVANGGQSGDNTHPSFAGHVNIAQTAYAGLDVVGLERRAASLPQPTIATLTVTPDTGEQEFGEPVTVSVALSPVDADGRVTIRDGATALATVTPTGGVAEYTSSAFALGNHSFSARFAAADSSRFRSVTTPPSDLLVLTAPLTDIITTNLLAELTVESLSGTANNAAVTTWTPARGAHLNALTGTGPTYLTDAGDGLPALNWASGASRLGPPTWTSPPTVGSGQVPLTFFLVYKIVTRGGSGNARIISGTANGSRYEHSVQSSGALAVGGGGTTATVPGYTVPTGEWLVDVVTLTNTPANAISFLPDGATAIPVTGFSGNSSLAGIGTGYVSSGWQMQTRAIIAYSGVMGQGDIALMVNYLREQYQA